MSVADTVSASHVAQAAGGRAAQPSAFEHLSLGQILNVRILERFDTHRYLVSFRGGEHVLQSDRALPTGATVRASVVAIGEKLELRHVEPTAGQTESLANGQDWLSALQTRYGLQLPVEDRARLADAVDRAAHALAMARGGMFLHKLAQPLDTQRLQALYAAQIGTKPGDATNAGGAEALDLATASSALADLLARSLDAPADSSAETPDDAPSAQFEAGSHESRDEGRSRDDLARWLLNLADDGSVGYRYGQFPLLIAGRLVELDLAFFEQRRDPGAAGSPARRLVMTLTTEALGAVQVVTHAVEDRLTVGFGVETARAANALAAGLEDLREQLSRFGWRVEAVRLDAVPNAERAAGHIIEHVLSAGTIDRLW